MYSQYIFTEPTGYKTLFNKICVYDGEKHLLLEWEENEPVGGEAVSG